MRHHLFLSVTHAIEKYILSGGFADAGVDRGWHAWRSNLDGDLITLPRQSELRRYVADDLLDRSHPLRRHVLADAVPRAISELQSA
jgi:hypothetical protein